MPIDHQTETAVRVLGIHVSSDGGLWYADGDRFPTRWSQTHDEFMAAEISRRTDVVRFVGTRLNVPLILAYFWAIQQGKEGPRQLQVASPLICPHYTDRHDPEVLLLSGRDCMLAPSVGGWHRFGRADFPAYALMRVFSGKITQTCAEYLSAHPAWRAVQFVNPARPALAQVICEMLDPRWFVDVAVPDRTARLEKYLGLTVPIMQTVLAGKRPKRGYARVLFDRCRAVHDTWQYGQQMHADDPRDFLRRIQRHNDGLKGTLRASQAFVRFLRQVWLEGIYTGTPQAGHLFVPEHFFKTQAEVSAYKSWMGN